MSDREETAESVEARLATLEQQTEWLAVELAQVRSVLESMVTVARDALLSDP